MIMDRIKNIMPLDRQAMQEAQNRWNQVAKPLHSLGKFEKMIVKIAGIAGSADFGLSKKCVVVMCADNGVVQEKITQSDSSVTYTVAEAMVRGDGNINNLCRRFLTDVFVVDAGMKRDFESPYQCLDNVFTIKMAAGTRNLRYEDAMTEEECRTLLKRAIDMAGVLKKRGYQMIATGEMGIGNTTTSAALSSIILDRPVCEMTGRGAGCSDEMLQKKKRVIEEALMRGRPDRSDPIRLLCQVGGYDIVGMAGLFLGGAIYRIPVVIDGVISLTAAAIASLIAPACLDYMIASHVSKEPSAGYLMEFLNLEPVLYGDLCLGEGTGAVMMFPLLDGVLEIYQSSHSFQNLHLEQYRELSDGGEREKSSAEAKSKG